LACQRKTGSSSVHGGNAENVARIANKLFLEKLAEMTTGAASKNTGHAEEKNTEEPKGKVVSSEK